MRSLFAIVSFSAALAFGVLSLVPMAAAEQTRVASLATGTKPALSPVERIKAGEINCPHCDLSGANLSNQCVKHGDLTGANFAHVTARYMCMSLANFTDVSFLDADLTGANLGHSNLTRADLTGAKLGITSIKGADLSTAKGLTQAQIDRACGDDETKLPPGLTVHSLFLRFSLRSVCHPGTPKSPRSAEGFF